MPFFLLLAILIATPALGEALVYTVPLQPSESAEVTAGISAQAQEIQAQEGQRVTRGDTLAILDEGTLRLTFGEADALFQKARGRFDRAMEMHRRGLISAQHLESVRCDAETARIGREKALHDLARSVVLSPLSGIVAECLLKVGDPVFPRMPLFRVVAVDDLKAELFVPADRLDGVRVGQAVKAHSVHPEGIVVYGKVVRVSPVLDPESGTCRVVALFPGAGKALRPGSVVRVRLGR